MSGDRIRQVRTAKNLTLDGLSEMAGVSKTYLSQIETGKRPGSVKTLAKICSAIGLPLAEVFQVDELESDEIELLTAFADLQGEDRKSVLRHAQVLARDVELRRILK